MYDVGAFSKDTARTVRSTAPGVTPVTWASPYPTSLTVARLALVVPHWNDAFLISTESVPVRRHRLADTSSVWPCSTTCLGTVTTTKTSLLLSVGHAQVTPVSATASITTGVARWRPRIQSNP